MMEHVRPEPRAQNPEPSRRGWWCIVGVGLLALCSCASNTISPEWKRVPPGVAANDFALTQVDGGPVRLSDYRGRVVIMEFWATWCGPCRFSLPSLEVIYKKYRDHGVTVLLLNQGETADSIKRWAGQRFTAPILMDERSDVAASYHVQGIPRLFLIDREGNLLYEHEGYGGGLERNLKLILDGLLGIGQSRRSGTSQV